MRNLACSIRNVACALLTMAMLAGLAPLLAQGRGGGRGAGAPPGGGGGRGPQPPRDATTSQNLPTGTSSITGAVLLGGTSTPARRARVTVQGPGLRGGRSTTTDEQGRYALTSLPAGRYTLSATKSGYLGVSYGQRQPGSGRPGTPIQLEEGQRLAIQLQMPRGGVLSGIVLDEMGEAVPGTQVRAFRYTLQGGTRTPVAAGSGATDDRGMYRIYGLQGGDYLVCATPRSSVPTPALDRIQELASTAVPQTAVGQRVATAVLDRIAAVQAEASNESAAAGYAPVYFPGTTTASTATTVPLGVGEERLGIDFQLQLVPMARVEGTVIFPSGQQPGNLQVQLINVGDNVAALGSNTARVDRDGAFRFASVAPGQYTLFASAGRTRPAPVSFTVPDASATGAPAGRGRAGGPAAPGGVQGRGNQAASDEPRMWASTDIAVDGRPLANIALTLQPAFSLSGRIEFRAGTLQPPSDLTHLGVSLTRAEETLAARQTSSGGVGRVDANGRFTIDGVVPGKYRMLAGGAQGWWLESATVGGQDALDFPLDVRAAAAGITLTFTDQQTTFSGTVVDAKEQPASDYTLLVYPSDQRYWLPQARRIRSVRPATDGQFSIAGLPPGEYRVAPVIDPEPGVWFDPTFLQQLEGSSQRLSLRDGEKKVQNVRVTGG